MHIHFSDMCTCIYIRIVLWNNNNILRELNKNIGINELMYHINAIYCYGSRAMRDAQLKRDKLFKENRKNECKRLRDSNCTTLMLIVVVTVFLMTEIPLAVVTVSNFVITLKFQKVWSIYYFEMISVPCYINIWSEFYNVKPCWK